MFKNNYKNLNKYSVAFIVILLIFTLLRFYLSLKLPYYFAVNSMHDDLLLLSSSDLPYYFHNWNWWSLSKNIIFSVFLFCVRVSGIPYNIFYSALWVFSGLFVLYACWRFISKNKIFLLLAYLFILFLPFGFDTVSATRIYRNSVFIPFQILFLTSLFIFVNKFISKENEGTIKLLLWGLLVGILFFINFYINEGGLVLLPIFIIPLIFALFFKIYVKIKNCKIHNEKILNKINLKYLLKITVIALIPVLIFSMGTIAYKEVNNHYFGVYSINTRLDGEMGDFYHNLLLIQDDNKNTSVWIPFSTVEKAWNASPTLQSHPEIKENLLHTSWTQNDSNNYYFICDLFTWGLREAVFNTNYFENDKVANDFFKQVNNELEESFANGSLEKSDKIFITSSLNGRSFDEILELTPNIKQALGMVMLYSCISFEPMADANILFNSPDLENVEHILNMELYSPQHNTSVNYNDFNFKIYDLDLVIYRLCAIFLVLVSFISFVICLIHQIVNKFKNRVLNSLLGFQILILGTLFVELFAICWLLSPHVDLVPTYINFYLTPCQAYFAIFEVFSIGSLLYILKNKFNNPSKSLINKFKN